MRRKRIRRRLLRREEFRQFHLSHPEVYHAFRRLALQLLDAGHRRGAAELIYNQIRWETALNPRKDGGYKLNNNYKPLYARMLAGRDPRFKDFFEFRGLRSEA